MHPQSIDVREELERLPRSAFHWRLIGIIAVITIFDGLDNGLPVYVIHFVQQPWHLSASQASLLASSGYIGFAVGSLGLGVLADRIGRRPTLVGSLLIVGLGSIATGLLANGLVSFLVMRVITGLGLGALVPLGVAYLSEFLPKRTRNRLVVLGISGFATGGVLAAVAGIVLAESAGWRWLFYLGGFAAPIGLFALWLLPESVEFLVARGRQAQAIKLLTRLCPERGPAYAGAVLSTVRQATGSKDWLLPLRTPYVLRTIALWATSFLLLSSIVTLAVWTPNLIIQRGSVVAVGFSFGAVLKLTPIIGALACGWLADQALGQSRSIALWAVLGGVSSLTLAFSHTIAVDLMAAAAAGFFVAGAQYILNNLCAMAYPVQARASAQGYMNGIGQVGSFVGPVVAGMLLDDFGGTAVVFVAVAVATGLAAVTALATRTRRTTVTVAVPVRQL